MIAIPEPIAKGNPNTDYPYSWSVNSYIVGEIATYERICDIKLFAKHLALFLEELQEVEIKDAPASGRHNFYRGGDLMVYHTETKEALIALKSILPMKSLSHIWEMALDTMWNKAPVWVHGDVTPGNLIVKNGRLCGVKWPKATLTHII